jgi:dynein heavy chain
MHITLKHMHRCLSLFRSAFVRWEDCLPPFHYDTVAPFSSIFVPTADTEKYGAMLRSCLEAGRPALLVGDSGAGKSTIVASQLELMARGFDAGGGCGGQDGGGRGVATALLACSALTGCGTVQGLLQSKLAKRSGRWGQRFRLITWV